MPIMKPVGTLIYTEDGMKEEHDQGKEKYMLSLFALHHNNKLHYAMLKYITIGILPSRMTMDCYVLFDGGVKHISCSGS